MLLLLLSPSDIDISAARDSAFSFEVHGSAWLLLNEELLSCADFSTVDCSVNGSSLDDPDLSSTLDEPITKSMGESTTKGFLPTREDVGVLHLDMDAGRGLIEEVTDAPSPDCEEIMDGERDFLNVFILLVLFRRCVEFTVSLLGFVQGSENKKKLCKKQISFQHSRIFLL